jgi:EpsI family protein
MSGRISLRFAVTAALLIGTLIASGLTGRRVSQPLAIPLERIDSNILGWSAFEDRTLPPHTLDALDATSYLSRGYRKGDRQLDLFIAFYAQQRAGESMHSPKHCLPGAGWEIWQQGSAVVTVNGKNTEINQYRIENQGVRELMFYWYQSRSRIIASEYLGKLLLARDTLVSGQTAGSIVRIMLPDIPGASQEGVAFAGQLIPGVWHCFGNNSNQNRVE